MMSTSPTPPPLSHDDAVEDTPARPQLSTRAWWAVAAGIAVLVAIASWFGWWFASVPVRWQEVGFTVQSPTITTITFDVYLYTDQPVRCDIEALNRFYAQVGFDSVMVDPAGGSEQRFTEDIATVEEATTAVVADCRPL